MSVLAATGFQNGTAKTIPANDAAIKKLQGGTMKVVGEKLVLS
jgi:hypothetical protein